MSLSDFPLLTFLSDITLVRSVLKRLPRSSLSSSSLSPPITPILVVDEVTPTDMSSSLFSVTTIMIGPNKLL